jgi:hypothetical protein
MHRIAILLSLHGNWRYLGWPVLMTGAYSDDQSGTEQHG